MSQTALALDVTCEVNGSTVEYEYRLKCVTDPIGSNPGGNPILTPGASDNQATRPGEVDDGTRSFGAWDSASWHHDTSNIFGDFGHNHDVDTMKVSGTIKPATSILGVAAVNTPGTSTTETLSLGVTPGQNGGINGGISNSNTVTNPTATRRATAGLVWAINLIRRVKNADGTFGDWEDLGPALPSVPPVYEEG